METVWMPATPDRPAEPAPYVLTEEDTARLLRLDQGNAYRTLRRYRDLGLLKATQVGKSVRYLLPDVLAFLDASKQANPR